MKLNAEEAALAASYLVRHGWRLGSAPVTALMDAVEYATAPRPTLCKNCRKPIIFDEPRKVWKHNDNNQFVSCSFLAEPPEDKFVGVV